MAKWKRHAGNINESSAGTVDLSGTTDDHVLFCVVHTEENLGNAYVTTGITIGGEDMEQFAIPATSDANIKTHLEVWKIDSSNATYHALSATDEDVVISGTVTNRKYYFILFDEVGDLDNAVTTWEKLDNSQLGTMTHTLASGKSGDALLQFHATDSAFSLDAQWTQDASLTKETIGNLGSPTVGAAYGYKTLDSTETSTTYDIDHDPAEVDWNGFAVLIPEAVSTYTGSVAETLDEVVPSATGKVGQTGSVAETLAAVAPSATGKVGQTGSAAATLDEVVSNASGTLTYTGSVAETLDEVSSSGTGTVTSFIGSVGKTIQAVTGSASGTSAPPAYREGTVDETLDNVEPTASGKVGQTGSAAVTLDGVASNANGTVGTKPTISLNDVTPLWTSFLVITPDDTLIEVPAFLAIDNGTDIDRVALFAASTTEATAALTADLFKAAAALQHIRPGVSVNLWLENATEGVLTQTTTMTIEVGAGDHTGTIGGGYAASNNLTTMFGAGAAVGDFYLTQVTAGALGGVDNQGQFSTPTRTPQTDTFTSVYDINNGVWRADVKDVSFVEPDSVDLFLDTQVPGFVFEFNATLTGIPLPGGAIKRCVLSTGDYLDAKSGATDVLASFQPARLDWVKNAQLAHTRLNQLYSVHLTNGFNDTATLTIIFAPPGPAPDGVVSQANFGELPADRVDLPANSVVPLAAVQGDEVLTYVSLGSMAFNGAFAPVQITTPATLDTTYFDISLGEWSTVKRDFLNRQGILTSIVFDLTTTARVGWAFLTLDPDVSGAALPGLQDNDPVEYNTYNGELVMSSDGTVAHTGTYGRMVKYERHTGTGWERLTTYVAGSSSLKADLNTTARVGWGLVQITGTTAKTAAGIAVGDSVAFDLDNGLFSINELGEPQYLGAVVGATIAYEVFRATGWTGYGHTTAPATGGTADITLDDVQTTTAGLIGLVASADVRLDDVQTNTAGAVGGVPGVLNVTLDEVGIVATGTRGAVAEADITLDDVTGQAFGRFERPGTLAEVLDPVVANAVGTVTGVNFDGTLEATLDDVGIVAVGRVVRIQGVGNATIPPATADGDATVGVRGSAAVIVSPPILEAVGSSRPNVTGSLDILVEEVLTETLGFFVEKPNVVNSSTVIDVGSLLVNSSTNVQLNPDQTELSEAV